MRYLELGAIGHKKVLMGDGRPSNGKVMYRSQGASTFDKEVERSENRRLSKKIAIFTYDATGKILRGLIYSTHRPEKLQIDLVFKKIFPDRLSPKRSNTKELNALSFRKS